MLSVPASELVPGDVVLLEPGDVHADMVILQGDYLTVDESALTGEGTPVRKKAINIRNLGEKYVLRNHSTITISAGTHILEVDEEGGNFALVLSTSSYTTKGKLLTDFLAYRAKNAFFNEEVQIVFLALLVQAMTMASLVFVWMSDQLVYAWFYGKRASSKPKHTPVNSPNFLFLIPGIFIVAAICHPLIPTVFVVAVGISSQRLGRKGISCTQPENLLVAGSVDVAFFDKTGTLTQQGMAFLSIECGGKGNRRLLDICKRGMAACHTLTVTRSGEFAGNQIDKASFESTGARIMPSKGGIPMVKFHGEVYTIEKTFDFDHDRQTQSVIIGDGKGSRFVFVKGSPESIRRSCLACTVPETFDDSANRAAKQAVYQLAMAFKSYDPNAAISDLARDEVESNLFFAGFLSFHNALRDETCEVLQELAGANIPTSIITGDNVLAGVAIAREAGMIRESSTLFVGRKISRREIQWINFDTEDVTQEPIKDILDSGGDCVNLAITGEAWDVLCSTEGNDSASIAKRIRVFGRCSPNDKVSVVSKFVENGSVTLMCGDGQNDCGSLRAAHVGVALSNADASIVAPFTAFDKGISAVTEVLREGRCTTASAFASYSSKYIKECSSSCACILLVLFIWFSFRYSIYPVRATGGFDQLRRPSPGAIHIRLVLGFLYWHCGHHHGI
jgi:magnesium-transporting ATPase (P-type)